MKKYTGIMREAIEKTLEMHRKALRTGLPLDEVKNGMFGDDTLCALCIASGELERENINAATCAPCPWVREHLATCSNRKAHGLDYNNSEQSIVRLQGWLDLEVEEETNQ